MKRISEPIYDDFITVNDEELPIFESPHVQRLRRIHQLGHSHYVYPAATHTRFEHSIGVMHLAGKMADSLGLNRDEKQAYRLGGLLHDIGHPPYSHSLESIMERQLGITHEERTCQLIDDIEAEFPVSRDWVKDIVMGKAEYDIVAGEVDVDRMDYLQRDAQRANIPHGDIDAAAIIGFAELQNSQIVFPEPAIYAIEALFDARRRMTTSVYRHHTAVIIEVMLRRAVEAFIQSGAAKTEEVVTWDDYRLHTYLSDIGGVSGKLYDRIANRELYKRSFQVGTEDVSRNKLCELAEISDVREIEKEIAEVVGADPHEVLVDPPTIPSESPYSVKIIRDGEIRELSDISAKPTALFEDQWRNASLEVYTPQEYVKPVRETAQLTIFGE